jgi:hypothetical protein
MMSVMFASRNGAAVLPRTLDSLAAARAPEGGWKLIAVDNASTDNSGELMRAYCDRLPLTVLEEPAAGKNRALNRALEEAEGDLYVFCDDDVVVAEDWLVKWREAADAHPECDLFGGATLPLWPWDPPQWVLDEVDHGVVFGTNERMREGACDAIAMFGTNMAIRARVFAQGVRFNADIGPDNSRAYPMGSETELARRLAALGYGAWFAEGARVGHIIRPQQMERPSMLMRAYRWGRGQAHMQMEHHYPPARLSRKNRLRAALYPLLMCVYGHKEAWARQWEWAVDQGFEDGWREGRKLPPRWLRHGKEPRIAARFRRSEPTA